MAMLLVFLDTQVFAMSPQNWWLVKVYLSTVPCCFLLSFINSFSFPKRQETWSLWLLLIELVLVPSPGFLIKFSFCTKLTQSYMLTVAQSTMMGQSYGIWIEGLKHIVPKWSNGSFKVGHLVFLLFQWCAIVAYQIL